MELPKKNFLIGNWKMKPATYKHAHDLVGDLDGMGSSRKTEVVICPPFPFLYLVHDHISKAKLGAQNVFPAEAASKTGEVSITQISSLGAKYVIVGHSERRALGDTDRQINEKIKALIKHQITPVVCVGEPHRDESGDYLGFLKEQIQKTFEGLDREAFENVIIAYEPIWAIGEGAEREPTAEEVRETVLYLKKIIDQMTGKFGSVGRLTFLYGGSVGNAEHIEKYMTIPEVSGVLVGRASINADDFQELFDAMEKL